MKIIQKGAIGLQRQVRKHVDDMYRPQIRDTDTVPYTYSIF